MMFRARARVRVCRIGWGRVQPDGPLPFLFLTLTVSHSSLLCSFSITPASFVIERGGGRSKTFRAYVTFLIILVSTGFPSLHYHPKSPFTAQLYGIEYLLHVRGGLDDYLQALSLPISWCCFCCLVDHNLFFLSQQYSCYQPGQIYHQRDFFHLYPKSTPFKLNAMKNYRLSF